MSSATPVVVQNPQSPDGGGQERPLGNLATHHQAALSMLDLSGPPPPLAGWLDVQLKIQPAKRLQICHSCGKRLAWQIPCSSCGHDFCFKCTADDSTMSRPCTPSTPMARQDFRGIRPSSQPASGAHETSLSTETADWKTRASTRQPVSIGLVESGPDANPISSEPPRMSLRTGGNGKEAIKEKLGISMRENPFFMADQAVKSLTSGLQTMPANVDAKWPRQLEDSKPSTSSSSASGIDVEQSCVSESQFRDVNCVMCCSTCRHLADNRRGQSPGRSMEMEEDVKDLWQHKFDQLGLNADDFHSSPTHAIQHLTNALQKLDGSAAADQDDVSAGFGSESGVMSSAATTTGSRHACVRSFDQGDSVPVASLSAKQDAENKLTVPALSPLRPHRMESDDVFGPTRHGANLINHCGFRNMGGELAPSRAPIQPVDTPVADASGCDTSSRMTSCSERRRQRGSGRGGQRIGKLPVSMAQLSSLATTSRASSGADNGKEASQDLGAKETKSGEQGDEWPGRLLEAGTLAGSDNGLTESSPALAAASTSTFGRDIPSMTGYPRHRQATTLCAPPQGPNTKPNPWPRLRRVDKAALERPEYGPRPAPWSRESLRKVVSHREGRWQRDDPGRIRVSDGGLRKGTKGISSPVKAAARSRPAWQWRELLEGRREWPREGRPRTARTCSYCDPEREPSPGGEDEGGGSCVHSTGSATGGGRWEQGGAGELGTPTRLRVRQVEHSLARRRAEEEAKEANKQQEARRSRLGRQREKEGEAGEALIKAETASTGGPGRRWRDGDTKFGPGVEKRKPGSKAGETGEGADGVGKENRSEKGVQQEAADDVGIEGLTIVVHMRYQDDLVINTDLKGDGPRAGRATKGTEGERREEYQEAC